jgi:hypothetical protein
LTDAGLLFLRVRADLLLGVFCMAVPRRSEHCWPTRKAGVLFSGHNRDGGGRNLATVSLPACRKKGVGRQPDVRVLSDERRSAEGGYAE